MKPNQMQTIRRLEEEVDIGKVTLLEPVAAILFYDITLSTVMSSCVQQVLFSDDGLAILEGLNNDAPVGASLRFVSGASGVLLWRRSDNVCFALILGGRQNVSAGDRVECRLKGILQVVDDAEGPSTKREYEVARVPVGAALCGQVVDFLGCPHGSQYQLGMDAQLPLLNDQLDMKSREQINSASFTGIKAVDTLTPLGRGQAQLLVGPPGSGKSSLAVDAILGQHMHQQPGSACVSTIALLAHVSSQQEVVGMVEELSKAGAMRNTTVVSAAEGCGLGERYAALCSALSMGERVRDQGGHSFVVLDDISCMGAMWEMISRALASLGPTAMAIATPLNPDQPILPPDTDASEGDEQQGLVEYEGMLVSASAAQRRRFFSSLIQRSAQVHRRLGGGSMTLLAILPGQPAKGERQPAATAEDYPNLTPCQRDKLLAALAKRQPPVAETLPGCVNTEVVEEFMSIADGQLVLQAPTPDRLHTPDNSKQPEASQQQVGASQDDAAPAWQRLTGSNVDVSASVSRIGSRAYPPAMAMLAPSIRFDLAQAVDAQRFGTDRSETGLHHHHLQRAALLRAALAQPVRQPVPLEEQVAQLYALQKGFFDRGSPETIQEAIAEAVMHIRQDHPDALERIRRTQCLGPMAEAVLKAALVDVKMHHRQKMHGGEERCLLVHVEQARTGKIWICTGSGLELQMLSDEQTNRCRMDNVDGIEQKMQAGA
ncbi:MAG: F0F1 ATP synthase subunit alpha [Trebouxia sp. A1-2]|nr:MAG: F0F1 ATP synthase subunit alpha [Trebouxia sp. A1-2]